MANLLREEGLAVVDADEASRRLTAPGGQAIAAIRRAFGDAFIGADGAMDRAAMRTLVFAEPAAKQRLEALLHPLVGAALADQAEQAQAAGAPAVVFDVPLLVESRRWRPQLDAVWVVDCLEATQVRRVQARSAAAGQRLTVEEVSAIMTQQASRAQRLACADAVLFNEGVSVAQLAQQVAALVRGWPGIAEAL